MKLNRLLEITTILLNKKSVKASELAERFSVSTRTIYRDIEVLSTSGVPVYATQGANGGISILEDYSVNRTILSDSEKNSIIFALRSLQSTKYPEVDTVLEKLGSIFKNKSTDWISIDFSPWGSNPNAYNKFIDIKTAIIQSKVIEIEYINTYNEKSYRKIEPLRLDFKYQAWYLRAYCLEKQDYRTFRISRIKKATITTQNFDRNKPHTVKEKPQHNKNEKPFTHLVLQFTEQALYRLCDDYDDDQIQNNGDGTYTLELYFPEDEWVYGYILSFGCFVKVIKPEHIRNIIRERSEKIAEFYK